MDITSIKIYGCSAAGRKRYVDHLISKRQSTTCASFSNSETLPSNILRALCTNIKSVVDTTNSACGGIAIPSASTTSSCLLDALRKGVSAIDALSTKDEIFVDHDSGIDLIQIQILIN